MNCKHCGSPLSDNVTACRFCGEPVLEPYVAPQQQMPYAAQTTAPVIKSENIFTGTIGALIGAAIGATVIILLSRLGFIASISGFILAICTLKGYEILGRRFSMAGLVICLILIVVTPYLADRLDWAILLKQSSPEISLWEAFTMVPDLIKYEFIEKSVYIKNLVMLYLFAAIGAFNTIRSLFA